MGELSRYELDAAAHTLANRVLGRVARDVSLSQLSAWRIGGKADLVFWPQGESDLIRGVTLIQKLGIKITVVGMTTNLLFADEGLRGALIVIASGHTKIETSESRLIVEAGTWTPHVAITAMRQGLTGIEHICGIPGTFGGLICMNGGSLRRSISENIEEIRIWSGSGPIRVLNANQCEFQYRASRFLHSNEFILSATLLLEHGNRATIRKTMLDILAARRRFPRKIPNCGSVFVSEPTTYREWGSPGAMIEKAGLKGTRIGGAMIARQHANFILNTGGATAADVLSLIRLVRSRIWESTGTWIRTEAHYVSMDGKITPATGSEE